MSWFCGPSKSAGRYLVNTALDGQGFSLIIKPVAYHFISVCACMLVHARVCVCVCVFVCTCMCLCVYVCECIFWICSGLS